MSPKIRRTTHFCTYLPLQRVGRWWFSFFEHSLGGIWFPRRQNKLETWNLRRPQNGSKSAFHFRALSQKVILGKHQLSVLSKVENPPQNWREKCWTPKSLSPSNRVEFHASQGDIIHWLTLVGPCNTKWGWGSHYQSCNPCDPAPCAENDKKNVHEEPYFRSLSVSNHPPSQACSEAHKMILNLPSP